MALSPSWRSLLRALLTGVCALILLLVPAVEAWPESQTSPPSGAKAALVAPAHYLETMRKDRQVLRFFASHAWLLSDPRFAVEAQRQVSLHRTSLVSARRKLARARAGIARARRARHRAQAAARAKSARAVEARRRRARTRQLAAVSSTPSAVICSVFGSYCGEALAVARCESGLRTTAQNGQYLGLFQMGSSERRLYGHGPSALEQVRAAHRYFLTSGRDWSPWSCKPRR